MIMPITQDDVTHMAALARLDIDEATRDRFTLQFADILTYMDVLDQVDTNGVEPLYSPSRHGEALRPDTPVDAEHRRSREAILSGAPEQDGEYFVVPRIV